MRVKVWHFRGEGKQFTWRWKSKWLTNVCWARQSCWDTQWTLTSELLSLSRHTQPTLFADVSGDSSILRTGHVPKFFRQLWERSKKNFLSLLLVKNNHPKLISC